MGFIGMMLMGIEKKILFFHSLVQGKAVMWHDALMHRAAFSGRYGLKKGCLVATRHQRASGSLWDGSRVGSLG